MSGDRIPLSSRAAIRRLILSLTVEQFLAATVGMVDAVMVASMREAAMSGVPIVNTLNILLINVFLALATGGAVVVSWYLGRKDEKAAYLASNRLILVGPLLSFAIVALTLVFNRQILTGIYGNTEVQVTDYVRTYSCLTALSFSFLMVYNGYAAICRSMGNSQISMRASTLMDAISIVGSAVLIFGFHMKVEDAVISTLTLRVVASAIMVVIIRNPRLQLHIDARLRLRHNRGPIGEILHIGVPVAVENGLFQGGKLLVVGLVSSLGTVSIAANAVAGAVASFQVIPGSAISLAMVIVVGQAVGAGRYEEARGYALKLCGATMLAHLAIRLPMTLCLPQIIGLYGMSAETTRLAYLVGSIHDISCVVIWAPSSALPNALRAADDAKFVMLVTLCSMGLCRVVMSCVLGRYFGMELVGVWTAMILDWVVRACILGWRFFSSEWLKRQERLEQIS